MFALCSFQVEAPRSIDTETETETEPNFEIKQSDYYLFLQKCRFCDSV